MNPHQDFKEIIFQNKSDTKKNTSQKIVVSKLQKELLQDGDIPKLKLFGKDNGRLLQNTRTIRKLTQEQLANQINEKKLVINQYEAGNVVPDNRVLNKLRKVLGIKFN
jgi:ribosome-binding protein aMBF1 (putative translation factor)